MSRDRGHPNPILVVGLFWRGHPQLEPQPWELRWGHRVELNQLLREVDQDPPQIREVDQDPLRTREVDKDPPRTREGVHLPPAKAEGPLPQVGVRGHQPPTKVQHLPPQELPLTSPLAVWEQATATGPAGIRLPCESPEVESLSPRGLPSQSHRPR